MTEEYKSSVYLEETERDAATGMIMKQKACVLKGQEDTKKLLKMAKKEIKWK